MTEWKSIDTAPTAYDPATESPPRLLVFGARQHKTAKPEVAVAWHFENEPGIWWTGEHGNSDIIYATHWAPLPEGPK